MSTGILFNWNMVYFSIVIYTVRNGKVSDHDKAATPVKYYTITYSKDVPNATSLPKTAKYGDIVTISLKTIISVAYDGWTREDGYNFDPKSDLTNGVILSDLTKSLQNQSYERIVQLKVTGDMKVNVSRYQEEYEAPYEKSCLLALSCYFLCELPFFRTVLN